MAVIKKLGFEGAVVITPDGGAATQVLGTSGSVTDDANISYYTAVDAPRIGNRTRWHMSIGTKSASASLGFDCSLTSLALVQTLLERGKKFVIDLHDGEGGWKLEDCYMTTLTLSGATGGLISASLSFSSKGAPTQTAIVPTAMGVCTAEYDAPLAYWYTGGTDAEDVKDWNLTFNQAVNLVYGNTASERPLYARIGTVDASLSVTTYNAVQKLERVIIATKTFTIAAGRSRSEGFSIGGQSDMGSYTHAFESSLTPDEGAIGDIITVS